MREYALGPEGAAAAATQPKRLLIANTHLFWDPRRPDVKAVQAALLGACITSFIDERILRGDKEEGVVGRGQASAGGHMPTNFPSVVICGDFNSVPYVQHEFLNARAKASGGAAEDAVDGGGASGMSEGGGQMSRAAIPVCEDESGEGDLDPAHASTEEVGWDDEEEEDPGIEEDKEEEEAEAYALLAMADGSAGGGGDAGSATAGAATAAAKLPSAVWSLMAEGCVPASHPEHPAAFGSSVNLPDLLTGLPPLKNAYEAHGHRVRSWESGVGDMSGGREWEI
jgi:hypothetical protein